MFKKLTKEEIHTRSNIKSSVQRGLKSKFVAQYPSCEEIIDDIVPKKSQMIHIKCEDKISVFTVDGEPVFFERMGDLYPALRVVHKYPSVFTTVQVDRGAIKFVLGGANIMCPGLTSPGAKMPEEVAKDTVVVVNAEGKENALAIGKLAMNVSEIRSLNKGVGVEMIHYLGDGLWCLPKE